MGNLSIIRTPMGMLTEKHDAIISLDDLKYFYDKYLSETYRGKPNPRIAKNLIEIIKAREVYLEAKTSEEKR